MHTVKDILWTVPPKLRLPLGLLIVAGLAFVLGQVFAGHRFSLFLPLGFVAVLVLLALCYGTMVGVLGSLLSAAIFGVTLFSPLGSLRVTDQAARENLAWMVLGGIALSFLFAPSNPTRKQS